MKCACVFLLSALACVSPAWGQSPPLLFDFSRVQHKPAEVTTADNQKVPAGTVELVEGQFGKACKFSFVASTGPQFFTAWMDPSDDWDQYEGFSFWVKGDGSQSYGGLEFIDGNDYSLRFGYCFPIESTEWGKITVPWSDLVPELAGASVRRASSMRRPRSTRPARAKRPCGDSTGCGTTCTWAPADTP